MPANVVKGPREERWWEDCKRFYEDKGYTDDRLYSATMGCFKQKKANAGAADRFAKDHRP